MKPLGGKNYGSIPHLGLNWQQSASAYLEIAALKEEIAKRDAEIARLNDRIEAYSIDLAVKEGKVKS